MIRDILNYWLGELRAIKQRYDEELKIMPEGRLYCSQGKDGYVRYYHATYDECDEIKRKGISSNIELRDKLARKAFLDKAVRVLDKDIVVLARAVKLWQPCLSKDIIALLPAPLSAISEQGFLSSYKETTDLRQVASLEHRVAAHKTWGQQSYICSDYHPEQLVIKTTFGLKVRSKAELSIAERLYDYGIPFRYEQVISIGGHTLIPDFTFEAADGSEFYLEFCGMMDDDDYVQHFYKKRARYERANIVPWRNIIYIYSTGNRLDMQLVEAVIQTQVMAWL